jgi:hypothetical protein
MKNFNSMFAIISGLDHKTVQRLQTTWERVPEKYKRIFEVNFLLLENLFSGLTVRRLNGQLKISFL